MGTAAVTAAGEIHGFPAALTSFIGRAGALREVAGLLEEYRLVTVTGPGGVGKTRLADEVTGQVAGRFADGAWLAELASVRDPARVAAVVAAALGIRERPGVTAAEALARVLAGQQLLLVLDNCEHVIGAAARLCAGLLAAADDVRVLATSREPLAVAGEARYRLSPLTLPGPGDGADGGRSEAVALFADQARQALGLDRAQAAEERGAAMSMDTAAEYALMLTDPGPPRSAPGPGNLSARERELVTLVAQGRTNAQIAAELYISVRTVGSHLDRIRDKTGCRRRADLTRLALSARLV